MLRNVVSPAYDPDETIPYKYGVQFDDVTAATNKLYWSDYDDNIGNEDGAHFIVLNAWNVEPGTKEITAIKLHGNYMGASHATAAYIELWKKDGTDLVRVAQSSNYIASIHVTYRVNLDLSATPFVVELEAGGEYYIGMHWVRNTAVASTPQPNRVVDTDFTLPMYVMGLSAAWADLTTVPLAGSASAPYANVSEQNSLVCLEISYTSTNYLEQDITSDTIGKYLIARPQDRSAFVKLEGVVVEDTNALTVTHHWIAAATFATTTYATAELDCGDTTPGQNDLIYEGNTVNLPDLDPAGTGAVGQEGKTFDLIFAITGNWSGMLYPLKHDLLWQCRHLESAIHSHAVANSSTRATKYDFTEPLQFMTTSGTAEIAKIRVGTNPAILAGDSQTIAGYNESLRYPNPLPWGRITTDFTKERMWILHGQAGQILRQMESGIFEHATPGAGDGIELAGLGGLWIFSGIGINDISTYASTSDADISQNVCLMAESLTSMLATILDRADTALLGGLPPSSAASIDNYEAKSIRWWNRVLLGIALGLRLPYYNPWPDMVTPGTEGNAKPTLLAAFDSGDGTHLAAAGGAYGSPRLAAALENATIDLRGAWD